MKNGKTLVIVESPSKAKTINKYLGEDYIVIASMGHIADLAKGGKFGIGIDVDNNFKTRYVLMDDKVKFVNEAMTLAEKCDKILLSQDGDREGEAIALHILDRISDGKKPIKRVIFKEITKKGIEDGIKNPRDIDMNICNSQESRRILDRIIGFQASPFLMNTIGPKLSAGRVQSVVTEMIIDREREIESFKPEEYWVIKACLSNDDKNAFWVKYDPKVASQAKAKEIKALLEGDKFNSIYVVTQVISDDEAKKPPPPMITSQLQRVMAKSFGFSADQTMKAAQSLYENGYVTYIRTDSVRTEPDAIKSVRSWLKENKYAVPKSPTVFKTKGEAQDAHECIRPTNLEIDANTKELSGDEKKVYEIIWKYFVASQMEPAIYDTMKVSIQLKDNKTCILKTSGKALKKKGFLEIMGVTDDSKIEIPLLSKGDELKLFGKTPVTTEKKQTQPLPRFSTDTMISEMEKRNIGRPATYAETLSKITSRNYVEMEGKTYRPTELGKQVTDALSKHFSFMEYNYTADLEKKLDDIEHGKLNYIDMLHTFYDAFKAELSKAYVANGSTLCEKCNSAMIIRTSKAGNKFSSCSRWPHCNFTKSVE